MMGLAALSGEYTELLTGRKRAPLHHRVVRPHCSLSWQGRGRGAQPDCCAQRASQGSTEPVVELLCGFLSGYVSRSGCTKPVYKCNRDYSRLTARVLDCPVALAEAAAEVNRSVCRAGAWQGAHWSGRGGDDAAPATFTSVQSLQKGLYTSL